jgi:hypothetical protein
MNFRLKCWSSPSSIRMQLLTALVTFCSVTDMLERLPASSLLGLGDFGKSGGH